MKRALSLISVILFFAVSFTAIAFAGGLFSNDENKTQTHIGVDGTETPANTAVTDRVPENPDIGNNASDVSDNEIEYLNSLKNALRPTVIEGLITDRTKVSLAERSAVYEKLAGGIPAIDSEHSVNTTGDYDPESGKIMLAAKGLYGDYTCGTEVNVVYNRINNVFNASYVTSATEVTGFRLKVKPYMGYLLVSSENGAGTIKISICDYTGKVIVDDIGDKDPFYARDYSNLPVFVDSSGTYYSFDGTDFSKITYAEIRSELYYDYPAKPLAEYNNIAEVKFVDQSFGARFVNINTKKNYITTKYLKAFNFSSNGLAVVGISGSRDVKIINTANKSMIGSTAWYIYPGSGAYVVYVYKLPDTFGIESIGCSGFDNGWLRVREQALSRMTSSKDTIFGDVDILVNADGKRFKIPDGYTLEGYSDGVLLLSNNLGKYGYYSINGYWIAQPIYTYARPFIQGLAVVGYSDGTVGMIDTEGNIVMPFVFTSLSDVSSGVICGYVEGIGWNTYLLTE